MLRTLFAVVLTAAASPAADEEVFNSHDKAPHNVVLHITEGTRLLAADADDGHDADDDYAPIFFERLSEEFPTRFTQNEDGVWVDAFGVYVFDEDEECYWENVSADELTRGRQGTGHPQGLTSPACPPFTSSSMPASAPSVRLRIRN